MSPDPNDQTQPGDESGRPAQEPLPNPDAPVDPKKIRRVGENIGQPEPDAVDIDPREGNTVDETWHRAGGKSPGKS